MPVRYASTFAYFCGCYQTMRSLLILNHFYQTFLHEKPHEYHGTRGPKTTPPILGQVAGRSERRYDRMVGEGDELDNWDYANIRWINLGKLWITDSDVLERGSSEGDILWSHSLSAARP